MASEEEEGAFVLRGGKRLLVITLEVSDEVAGSREMAEALAVITVADAAAAALEVADGAATPSDTAATTAAVAATTTVAESVEVEGPAEIAAESTSQGTASSGTEEAFEVEPEAPYVYLRVAEAAAHRSTMTEVLPLFGKPDAPDNLAVVYLIDTNALHDPEEVIAASRRSGMPEPPNPPEWVPPPETRQIVTRPQQRLARKPVTHFEILTPTEQPVWPGAAPEASSNPTPEVVDADEVPKVEAEVREVKNAREARESKGGKLGKETRHSKGGGDAKGAENATDDQTPQRTGMSTQTRWTVPAGGAVQVVVRFASHDVGVFTEELGFEVVGGQFGGGIEVSAKGTCDYPKISDNYRNVYYRKTKVRPASASVYHQYVISRTPSVPGKFEFGPLLCNKPTPAAPPAWTEGDVDGDNAPVPRPVPGSHHPPENIERLRITNNGLFECTVAFSVETRASEQEERVEEAVESKEAKGGKGGKDAGGSKGQGTAVFTLEPTEMTLGVDETRELLVMGYPCEVGAQEACIVAAVVDNPSDVEFPLSCVGVTPAVVLDLDDAVGIAFERLLCGCTEHKTFTIKNTCLLPVKWTLDLPADLPPEFTVSHTDGELPANGEQQITVSFAASEKKVFDACLKLKVFDVEALLGVHQEKEIKISAEAYKIEVVLKYPGEKEDASGVDFGLVKAVEDTLKQFSFTNTGKYQVGFKFGIKTAATRELFIVTPSEGEVAPGESVTIDLHFNKLRTLKQEVTLKANTDITLSISEPTTGVKHEKFPVRVTLRAAFTKYSILPARGMNFGPLVYNTTSNPRSFEITNAGEFPFDFSLFNYGGKGTEEEEDSKGGKEEPKTGTKDGGADKLKLSLGNFSVTPAAGTVEPGEHATVSVTFLAENSRNYVELAGIEITDRDPSDQPLGVPYEIAGES